MLGGPVVDSAGTSDCGSARVAPGDRPATTSTEERLKAMRLSVRAPIAHRLAPIGVEFDGRSVPWSR
jgi:hypothetical protein